MNYTDETNEQLHVYLVEIEAILRQRGKARYSPAVPLKVLLIVDDEFAILSLLEETFSIGYNVITATTAKTALKAALAHPPNIAIVDWSLNGESGGVLSWQLHELYPRIPIIILSALAVSQEDAINCGAKMAILKPYSPMGLADTMRRLLEEVERVDDVLN